MTREPDRYEVKARDLYRYCKREMGSDEPASYDCPHPSVDDVAAALRQAADEALERAAQRIAWIQPEYTAHEVQRQIRELKSPAAAPAPEPTAPSLLPRVLAALENPGSPGEVADVAAELRRYIADGEGKT